MYRESPERRHPGRILSVGRFSPGGHCKRQDVLVDAFREVVERAGRDDVELHLAGTVPPDRDARDYLLDVQRRAHGLPVFFHLNVPNAAMRDLYETASFYWHATGYGTSGVLAPELQEHFGISVVEAMSAGVIPLVYGTAGPAELVRAGVDGRHWTTPEELVRTQIELFERDDLGPMRGRAKLAARAYDAFAFRSAFEAILTPQPYAEPPMAAIASR